jgi:hypothetical protein
MSQYANMRTPLFAKKVPGGAITVTDESFSTGKRFFVHSGTGSSTNDGFSPDSPLATVDAAINLCTADKNDIIYVMPGHAETIAAADGFDADIAGISIIGLGKGTNRPTFTFSATASTAAVGAANVTLKNLRFVAGVSAVVVGLSVEAAGTDLTVDGCEWYWSGTTGRDFVDSIILAAGASRAKIVNNRFLAEPAVAGAATAIKLSGASHNVVIRDNEFMGDYSTACVNAITTLSQGLMFIDNFVHNTDASEPYLEVITGTTGIISGTRGLASGATVAANAVADAMAHCENYVVNTTGTIAIIKGAGGSPALDAD